MTSVSGSRWPPSPRQTRLDLRSQGMPPATAPNGTCEHHAPSWLRHARRSGDVGVDVGVLGVDDRLHVGHVMLEPVAAHCGDDAHGHLLRAELGTVVDGIVVVGLVPDLGVDGAWLD